MPYIKQTQQAELIPLLDTLLSKIVEIQSRSETTDYGILEYCIFYLVIQLGTLNLKFNNLNALVGVLETTKAELISRLLSPYESIKLMDNWKDKNNATSKKE